MRYQPPYDESRKASIIARVLAGETPTEISRKENIADKTIREWIKALPSEAVINPIISNSVVLVIPDMHHPFCHPHALHFLMAVKDKYQPSEYVCLGDEIDAHAFSRYPMDPDGLSAGQELKAAIESLIPFYREFPRMKVCESNHTIRPWKKSFEAGLPASFLPTVSKVLNAPDGWVWDKKHVIDGVLYVHGDNGRSGKMAASYYMQQAKQPVVIGHIHSHASVFYEGPHFAMNTGCLINVDSYCFKYAKGALLPVSLGCGIVKNGKEAHFIPMHVDSNNNWTGEI